MSFLIKDTTREERLELAKNALGIALSSDKLPSKEVVKLVNLYVNGKMELDEVKKRVIEMYKEV